MLHSCGLFVTDKVFIYMAICRKCNEDLSSNNFATYYHSTQRKYRTRRICNQCISIQKKEYKLRLKQSDSVLITPDPTPTLTPDINSRYCKTCDTIKPITDYYIHTLSKCKECCRRIESELNKQIRKEKGGSEKVLSKPNTYLDEYQRQQTTMVLEALGYTYNEENGIWYKLPWKTETGEFPFIEKTGSRHKLELKNKKVTVYNKIDNGIPVHQISTELGIKIGTIYKWLRNRRSSELEK